MSLDDLKPIVNIGTAEKPIMALCATTMMMIYEAETGKKYDPESDDDLIKFIDDYRDEYNANLQKSFDSLPDYLKDWHPSPDSFKLTKVEQV